MRVVTFVGIGLALSLLACSAREEPQPVIITEEVPVQENAVPGTVSGYWVEPMYNQVRVPAKIDPSGNYYRPSHQTIVEIRPGRFQEVQFSDQVEAQKKEKDQK